MLGISINDITAELVEDKKLSSYQGVYVQAVNKNSAAEGAKLKQGDVILKINNREVNSVAELQEVVARYRPGNKITLTFLRGGKEMTSSVMLKSKAGEVAIITPDVPKVEYFDELGAELTTLSTKEKEQLELKQGLRVTDLKKRGKLAEAGVKEGMILTHIDKKPLNSIADVTTIIKKLKGGVLIEAYDEDKAEKLYFAIGF
jgi:S1-C subfamily serine protease